MSIRVFFSLFFFRIFVAEHDNSPRAAISGTCIPSSRKNEYIGVGSHPRAFRVHVRFRYRRKRRAEMAILSRRRSVIRYCKECYEQEPHRKRHVFSCQKTDGSGKIRCYGEYILSDRSFALISHYGLQQVTAP
ncbi:uncharacterized protein EV420DRAFT_1500637 [Desarmillaria tabescens]|uniref:Secreted protein n=1 Tax=Armillaria tabescens TaxID=1929756 RepID=A0AA39TUD5_ARMTA|nr:uncharacterized protein EV420DRAFT_1500637 [Desarmillaria tabescens]KAK0470427.1 hypothetical protein EV420DRAFT_1500637 [Desarmillaria tabescens]